MIYKIYNDENKQSSTEPVVGSKLTGTKYYPIYSNDGETRLGMQMPVYSVKDEEHQLEMQMREFLV